MSQTFFEYAPEEEINDYCVSIGDMRCYHENVYICTLNCRVFADGVWNDIMGPG